MPRVHPRSWLGALALLTLTAAPRAEVGATTRYEYDEVGNRVAQIDAEGRVTRWTFDAARRPTSRTLPGGETEQFDYDRVGDLVAHRDFRGRVTRYRHDAMHRLIAIDYPDDADVRFTYTANGLRESVTDARGTTRHRYDARDRLIETISPEGRAMRYGYDVVGRLIHRESPHARHDFTYDALDRLTAVTVAIDDGPARTTTFSYDAIGRRTAMRGADGVTTEYDYDALDRVTALRQHGPHGQLQFAAQYRHDPSGLRTRIEESDADGPLRAIDYGYDGVRRLVRESITHRDASQNRQTTWRYDNVGNRLTETVALASGTSIATRYTYDANDRLIETTVGTAVTRYAYDEAGNTLSRDGPEGRVEYAYDDANRLVEAHDAQGRTTFSYDVDGIRVSQTRFEGALATTDHFLIDAQGPLAEVAEHWRARDGGSPRLARVFSYANQPLAQTDCTQPETQGCGGAVTRFLHADVLGSTRWVTDEAGEVTGDFWFDAFGNLLASAGATDIVQRFRGESFDLRQGWYYLRARYLDPFLGRFTQGDPLEGAKTDPTSLHRYAYANNDPINRLDPTGQFGAAEQMAAVGIAAAIATAAAVATYYVIQPVNGGAQRRFQLWDALALSYFGVGQAQVSARDRDKEKEHAAEIATTVATAKFGHHTIPVYLCGGMAQRTSRLALHEHLSIHLEIAQIRLALEGAESYANKAIGWKRSQALLRVAETAEGRLSIVRALRTVYESGEWIGKGEPQLLSVFESESPPFLNGTNTSLPWCSRNGKP